LNSKDIGTFCLRIKNKKPLKDSVGQYAIPKGDFHFCLYLTSRYLPSALQINDENIRLMTQIYG
jgi:hypothetical protein